MGWRTHDKNEKIALITGITGQDGAYLAQLLLQKGYRVHGIRRRSSSCNTGRIASHGEIARKGDHYGDLAGASSILRLIHEIQPDEIYNLGAQGRSRRLILDKPLRN